MGPAFVVPTSRTTLRKKRSNWDEALSAEFVRSGERESEKGDSEEGRKKKKKWDRNNGQGKLSHLSKLARTQTRIERVALLLFLLLLSRKVVVLFYSISMDYQEEMDDENGEEEEGALELG